MNRVHRFHTGSNRVQGTSSTGSTTYYVGGTGTRFIHRLAWTRLERAQQASEDGGATPHPRSIAVRER